MNIKKHSAVLVMCLVVTLAISGCAQQPKSANSAEAIQQADRLGSVQEKTKYLISEANAFVSSQKFDDAINTAKYVLSKLDTQSQEAKDIIAKAQAEIKKMAEQKAQEMKNKLGSFGK